MILTEEEDEDSLVEEGREIERGTVFLGETCHHETHQRNIRDKRFPRDACFDLGDVKVENVIVTFNEREDEDILNDADEDEDSLVEDGPQIDLGTVFLWDTCHREIYQRNSRGKRFSREACFDLVDVEVDETHCDLI